MCSVDATSVYQSLSILHSQMETLPIQLLFTTSIHLRMSTSKQSSLSGQSYNTTTPTSPYQYLDLEPKFLLSLIVPTTALQLMVISSTQNVMASTA